MGVTNGERRGGYSMESAVTELALDLSSVKIEEGQVWLIETADGCEHVRIASCTSNSVEYHLVHFAKDRNRWLAYSSIMADDLDSFRNEIRSLRSSYMGFYTR